MTDPKSSKRPLPLDGHLVFPDLSVDDYLAEIRKLHPPEVPPAKASRPAKKRGKKAA